MAARRPAQPMSLRYTFPSFCFAASNAPNRRLELKAGRSGEIFPVFIPLGVQPCSVRSKGASGVSYVRAKPSSPGAWNCAARSARRRCSIEQGPPCPSDHSLISSSLLSLYPPKRFTLQCRGTPLKRLILHSLVTSNDQSVVTSFRL